MIDPDSRHAATRYPAIIPQNITLPKKEHCLNCNTTVGMASNSAQGFWGPDNTYIGGLCPNCVYYPERLTPRTIALIGDEE